MRRQRPQKGHLYKRGNWWVLRYRQVENTGGELKTVQRAVQLVERTGEYRSKICVLRSDIFKNKMAEINKNNDSREVPAGAYRIGDFIENVYLPHVKRYKRPSTHKGYKDIWEDHMKARCADVFLCDVKTRDVQRLLDRIADEDKLAPNSLKHNKHFLSGVYKFAKKQNHVPRGFENPVTNADIPEAPEAQETYAYSLEEVKTMLMLLPEPSRTSVAVAALTGMRASEIRGLEWSAYDSTAKTISVTQSRWRKYTTAPKTKKSRAPIPVIPYLAKILEAHKLREGNPTTGPMFRNGRGNPLCIDSLGQRVIRKVKGIDWHGWHAFRRGLATNLNRLGVDDSVIQRILRHSTVAVTQGHYIKTVSADAVKALQQFENALENSLMCATVRQNEEQVVVN